MSQSLEGKKVAILVTNGFEESELTQPRSALQAAGARVDIVSLKKEAVKSWKAHDWGAEFPIDLHIDEARVDDYDALVLPGGVMNPDYLRMDERAVRFVRQFVQSGKPVAAVCHGPWTLVEADVVRGRRLTSYPSLRTDLQNAGATWTDEEVVRDGNLITSRRPDDLAAFCQATIEAIAGARR
ncbi:MAG TPA: type 1 glutamine amidotransferase domain-containing protein [Polyangiaceae bacterium]|nr:type 1 glutamine amidotransferase domain-containing protein [Polyangiaceae bacterium]